MSKSLKGLLVLALAGAAANSAMAADGKITFTGEIIASSCTLEDGTSGGTVGGDKKNISVPLGTVSADALADSENGANITGAQNINLSLKCGEAEGANTLVMTFQPATGSGIDTSNTKLLKLSPGGATGVGIGLFDSNNTLLDLNNPLTQIEGGLVVTGDGGTPEKFTGTATLNLRAAYVKNSAAAIVPGMANGDLPFVLTYK